MSAFEGNPLDLEARRLSDVIYIALGTREPSSVAAWIAEARALAHAGREDRQRLDFLNEVESPRCIQAAGDPDTNDWRTAIDGLRARSGRSQDSEASNG